MFITTWLLHDGQNYKNKAQIEGKKNNETIVTKRLNVGGFLFTVDEVALLLPDEKGITQSRKDEASQDLAGIGVSTEEAESMC